MKRHLLLIGFSCTGKTRLGKKAFEDESILDSDIELRKWIRDMTGERFDHVFEIYMKFGRDRAIDLIVQAKEALIDRWAHDRDPRIISLGPSFPSRENWAQLRSISKVVLFKRSPEGIYQGLISRREKIFLECPEAKNHDNWDVGVIVDAHRKEYPQQVAITNIRRLLTQRKKYYSDNDTEVNTDNWKEALQKLRSLKFAPE